MKNKKWTYIFALVLAVLLIANVDGECGEKSPDCTGRESWAASMAYVFLKNEGYIKSGEVYTAKTKVVRLASEKISNDLYRQVHKIVYYAHSGKTIEVITVNSASWEECSMSPVDVYVVSKISQN